MPTAKINPQREVRYAVVMYGGVSLAIYINGVAQELFQLSLSTATSPGASGEPLEPEPKGTAATYRMLARLLTLGPSHLEALERQMPEDKTGVDALGALVENLGGDIRVKFVVDTISGTSAGGINGVFLGKALACNQELIGLEAVRGDPLTDKERRWSPKFGQCAKL